MSSNTNNIYRSYTITCNEDEWNILNGRCPNYAINWNNNVNQLHWPKNHDYINGYQNTPKREDYIKHKEEYIKNKNKIINIFVSQLYK